MIVYLDTSSLLKLYFFDEEGADDVRNTLSIPDVVVATAAIAYVEAHSAFGRRRRDRKLTAAAAAAMARALDDDWLHYLIVDMSEAVLRRSAALAMQHKLKALDAIHLASYLDLVEQNEGQETDFSSFDATLNRAVPSALRALKR